MSISIPYSVITIKNNAFFRCAGLISVSFESGITTIHKDAFASCYNLSSEVREVLCARFGS